MENNKSTTNKGLIILLLLSLAGNVFQWFSGNSKISGLETKNQELVTARVDIEKELDATRDELNKFRGDNQRIDSLLLEANNRLDEQQIRIEKLTRSEKNATALNNKLKTELEELKKLRNQYLEKIDELLVENTKLKKEKEELTSTVETISKNLENTVSVASVLKSEYVKVKAYKKRGSGKYSETAMAKRTNKLEACFTILDNKIAKPGEKTVYMRIVEPGGKTMGNRGEGSNTFTLMGSKEEVMYTVSSKINYDNNRQDLCMSWEESERIFTSGTYLIEIYIDGSLSIAASYVLK
jgi:myosin heavy subunit